MRPFSSFFEPFHRGLARQVEQLRLTLERLCHRLRDSIAQAVAQAAANAVRDALAAVAGETTTRFPADEYQRQPSSMVWDEDRYHEGWHDDLDDHRFVGDEPRREPAVPSASRLASALAIGLRVAAWALQRAGRFCFPVAVGAGLLVAAATYAGGPLIAASVGCAGSLACLLSLDQSVPAEPAPLTGRANW